MIYAKNRPLKLEATRHFCYNSLCRE